MIVGGAADPALPDVAVAMITYNHEPFIAESMRSVFAQDYGGNIHVVVSDDRSTDRTQDVIVETAATAPPNVVVHLVLRESNVGGFANLSETWEAAHATGSAYIALLEGDDYWSDPHKLSDQVSYLESHPKATISFALASELKLFEDPPTTEVVVIPPVDHPSFGDLLSENFVHTCTVLYRAGVLPRFPDWFAECYFRDWPLHLVHARAGEIHYLDRVVAVHRQHESSRWWTPTRSQRDRVQATEAIQRLAIAHLGTKDNYKRAQVVAARQVWRAGASRNRAERYLHLAAAAALDPRRAARKLRGGRSRQLPAELLSP